MILGEDNEFETIYCGSVIFFNLLKPILWLSSVIFKSQMSGGVKFQI